MESPSQEISLAPLAGWHCSHLFYKFDRARLTTMNPAQITGGCEQAVAILDPAGTDAPARLQTSVVSGHKADFGLMLLDPNPLKIDSIHQRLLASCLGPALVPTYSFTSITEVSEYVPTLEQYGSRLVEEGEQRDSPAYKAKLKAYESREEMMRKQRLTPELPPWPSTCFYPMNKKRKVGENWFTLPFAERSRLMAEHGRTGMTFGGKVTQLDYHLDRFRRLGMGRHPLGPQPAVPQRHRLHHAVRRSQRPLRRVWPVLRQLRHDASRDAQALPHHAEMN